MQKDDAFWLRAAYIVFGSIMAYTAWKAVTMLGIQTGWLERYDEWFPVAGSIASVGIGALIVWAFARKKDRHEYFKASIGELRKVSWPSFIDTRRMTIVVCVVVGIFACILAVFDFAWSKILRMLLA